MKNSNGSVYQKRARFFHALCIVRPNVSVLIFPLESEFFTSGKISPTHTRCPMLTSLSFGHKRRYEEVRALFFWGPSLKELLYHQQCTLTPQKKLLILSKSKVQSGEKGTRVPGIISIYTPYIKSFLGLMYLVRSFLSRPKYAIRGTGILGRI